MTQAHAASTRHVARPALDPSPAGIGRLGALVSPFGLVSRSARIAVPDGDPSFAVYVSSVGDPSRALAGMETWAEGADVGNINGVGSSLDPEHARFVSIAESLERYALCAWHAGDLLTAAERDLSVDVVSPARLPRCSARELADPACRLGAYAPRVPIRWVRGWSLTHHRPVLVPAVAVFLNLPPVTTAEHFTRSVTTGAAVHSDLRTAVVNGLVEVVERDALSLAWLQRLRLPRLEVEPQDLAGEPRASFLRGTGRNLNVRLFDATTDLGIPVIYALQLSDCDPTLAQVVCATSNLDAGVAVGKSYRELAALRVALADHASRTTAQRPADDRVSVVGAALYSAARDRRHVFDHLLTGPRDTRTLADLPRVPAGRDPLDHAVDALRARGAEVVAVDVTPDEARMVGMHAVKVIVPEAVPLSFVHAERFLATPRLYSAPPAMGHPAHDEDGINPNPQPFA